MKMSKIAQLVCARAHSQKLRFEHFHMPPDGSESSKIPAGADLLAPLLGLLM